jgi:hypothetical protein
MPPGSHATSSTFPQTGDAAKDPSPRNALIATWGVLGVVLLLSQAVVRLTPLALEPDRSLGPVSVAAYVAWAAFSLYFEGYRAFQLRFCPRVVARAFHLARQPRPLFVALAPAFCMGFFHANRRTKILAWGTTTMVVCLVLLMRRAPQPFRGIVDGGVVLALVYGTVALLVLFARGFSNPESLASAELPGA